MTAAPPMESSSAAASGSRSTWAGLRRLGIYAGLWTLLALYIISFGLLFDRRPLGFDLRLKFAGIILLRSYGWALVSLITLALLQRFPFQPGARLQTWSLHLTASFLVTLLGIGMMAATVPVYFTPRHGFLDRAWMIAKQHFHFSYLVYYWGVVGLHEGIRLFRRFKERERDSLRLQAQLLEAQAQALNLHLSPHFLFNALNTVAALTHIDPAVGDRILVKLSGLLRKSLTQAAAQVSTLNQELAFLETYLEIEQLRFADRFKTDIQVPSHLLEAVVPTFLLQPLVENAIKHGVSPRAAGARIVLRAFQEGTSLVLEVEDDGPGSPGAPPGPGTRSARHRLQSLFGPAQSCQLLFPPEGGARARIRIPLIYKDLPGAADGGMP